jgi:hypothetical protein
MDSKGSQLAKATREGDQDMGRIELFSIWRRGTSRLEKHVLLDHEIQDCLRQYVQPQDWNFRVTLGARISSGGKLDQVRSQSQTPGLDACLTQALGRLKFPAAHELGEFRLEISRQPPQDGSKATSFLLQLQEVKKFQ